MPTTELLTHPRRIGQAQALASLWADVSPETRVRLMVWLLKLISVGESWQRVEVLMAFVREVCT